MMNKIFHPVIVITMLFMIIIPGDFVQANDKRENNHPQNELNFPIRAAFYYPWFPEAWDQSGFSHFTRYTPTNGYYSNDDPNVVVNHIHAMQYGKIQVGIASWWGQGHKTDLRISSILKAAEGTNFLWTLYLEGEGYSNPTEDSIKADLIYIRDHYTKNQEFLHIDGKFVVFVYGGIVEDCTMPMRWKTANTVNAFIVLKIFPGYKKCSAQPDAWHQYSPAISQRQVGSDSYSISPGFDMVNNPNLILSRDIPRWQQDIRSMVESQADFQLITTFNEWGEGTAVENAVEWTTASGYGSYLDALHWDGYYPTILRIDPDETFINNKMVVSSSLNE